MIEILESGLCKGIVGCLFLVAMLILWIIFHEGAIEDAEKRTYYGIDRYILPFLAVVAIPHIYIAYILINNGFILLYIFNLVAIFLLWFISYNYVIGGADALCFIFVSILLPFVIPIVIMTISTLIIEKIIRWKSPSTDAEWKTGKVPLLVPGQYGYLVTLPITVIFLILVIMRI